MPIFFQTKSNKIFAVRKLRIEVIDEKIHFIADFGGDKEEAKKFLDQFSTALENICLKNYENYWWVDE